MCLSRLPLYLFKCTSDKSSIQLGQGLPRLIPLQPTCSAHLSTAIYRRHSVTAGSEAAGLACCSSCCLSMSACMALSLGVYESLGGGEEQMALEARVPVYQIKRKASPYQPRSENGKLRRLTETNI